MPADTSHSTIVIDIDDVLANNAKGLDAKALLFGDYTWNQTNTLSAGVKRVNDWSAVEEYFYGSVNV